MINAKRKGIFQTFFNEKLHILSVATETTFILFNVFSIARHLIQGAYSKENFCFAIYCCTILNPILMSDLFLYIILVLFNSIYYSYVLFTHFFLFTSYSFSFAMITEMLAKID